MSVGICGYIDFECNSVSDLIEYSFYIMSQATLYRLGCKIGGNISDYARSILDNELTSSNIFMEIMDTPLDNFANALCQPSINNIVDPHLDIEDKIMMNLTCLQEFLQGIFNFKNVNKIVLHFNYLFNQNDEKVLEITADKFSQVMIQCYKQNDCFAPELKIIINNV